MPVVYAHRGASIEEPENTLDAFRVALEVGAQAIETDAHMTKDGRIVLSHDGTGERTAGIARAFCDATLAEVREWDMGARASPARATRKRQRIVTLDEALSAFPGVFFNVDAKQPWPDMIPALLRVVRGARAEHRVRIASFHLRNLARARRLGYEGPTGLAPIEVVRALCAPRGLWRLSGDAAQVPPRGWGITFARRRVIDRFHALGLRVDFWTVDDPEEAKRLVALGADGIVTNDPRRVSAALR